MIFGPLMPFSIFLSEAPHCSRSRREGPRPHRLLGVSGRFYLSLNNKTDLSQVATTRLPAVFFLALLAFFLSLTYQSLINHLSIAIRVAAPFVGFFCHCSGILCAHLPAEIQEIAGRLAFFRAQKTGVMAATAASRPSRPSRRVSWRRETRAARTTHRPQSRQHGRTPHEARHCV